MAEKHMNKKELSIFFAHSLWRYISDGASYVVWKQRFHRSECISQCTDDVSGSRGHAGVSAGRKRQTAGARMVFHGLSSVDRGTDRRVCAVSGDAGENGDYAWWRDFRVDDDNTAGSDRRKYFLLDCASGGWKGPKERLRTWLEERESGLAVYAAV